MPGEFTATSLLNNVYAFLFVYQEGRLTFMFATGNIVKAERAGFSNLLDTDEQMGFLYSAFLLQVL